MKKIAKLHENSDKFTKVANEWLASKLGSRALCFGLKAVWSALLPRFGAKKSAKSRKRCRLRAKKTINEGKLQTALKVLNSLFKFAILHEYTKHKFIANIDKTAL